MAHTSHSSDSHHHEHHVTPPSVYWKVLFALTVLMIATVFVAVRVQFGDFLFIPGVWVNNIVAIAIAIAKALLVIWFFMGVKHASSLTKIWVVAGFLTLGVMYFILGDYFTRSFEPAPSWTGRDGSALPRNFKPLNQDVPPNVDLNVRPRQ